MDDPSEILRLIESHRENQPETEPIWLAKRKLAAAEKATTMSSEGALVKAADQLHNLKALEESLSTATDPEEVWAHFNGGRAGTIEMATRLLEALTGRVDPRITEASDIALAAIRG